MTVHTIQIVTATEQRSDPPTVPTPEPPALPDVIPDRVTEHVLSVFEEALSGQAEPAREVPGDDAGEIPAHVRGKRRFASSEDRVALLDAFEQDVVIDAKWYRIDYHECDHDSPATDRSGCSAWSTKREYGAVPEGV